MKKRLTAASIAVFNHAKKLINVEGTSGSGNTKLHYNTNPSLPGEPPHKQTGRLLGSVAFELVGYVARVGTNLKYGRWLEMGTKKMQPRPWLRRALAEMRAKVEALLSAPFEPKSP